MRNKAQIQYLKALIRKNPQRKGETSDAYIRRLERLAATGDAEANAELQIARQRYQIKQEPENVMLFREGMRNLIVKQNKKLKLKDGDLGEVVLKTTNMILKAVQNRDESAGMAVLPHIWAYFADAETFADVLTEEEIEEEEFDYAFGISRKVKTKSVPAKLGFFVYASPEDLKNRRKSAKMKKDISSVVPKSLLALVRPEGYTEKTGQDIEDQYF